MRERERRERKKEREREGEYSQQVERLSQFPEVKAGFKHNHTRVRVGFQLAERGIYE